MYTSIKDKNYQRIIFACAALGATCAGSAGFAFDFISNLLDQYNFLRQTKSSPPSFHMTKSGLFWGATAGGVLGGAVCGSISAGKGMVSIINSIKNDEVINKSIKDSLSNANFRKMFESFSKRRLISSPAFFISVYAISALGALSLFLYEKSKYKEQENTLEHLFTIEDVAKKLKISPKMIQKICMTEGVNSYPRIEIIFQPAFYNYEHIENMIRTLREHDVESFLERMGSRLIIHTDSLNDFHCFITGKVSESPFFQFNEPVGLSPLTIKEIAQAFDVLPEKIRRLKPDFYGSLRIEFKPSFKAHEQMNGISQNLKKHDVDNRYSTGGLCLNSEMVIENTKRSQFVNFIKTQQAPHSTPHNETESLPFTHNELAKALGFRSSEISEITEGFHNGFIITFAPSVKFLLPETPLVEELIRPEWYGYEPEDETPYLSKALTKHGITARYHGNGSWLIDGKDEFIQFVNKQQAPASSALLNGTSSMFRPNSQKEKKDLLNNMPGISGPN